VTDPEWISQLLQWEVIAAVLLVLLLIGSVFTLSLGRLVRRRTAQLQSIFDHMQEVLYRTDEKGLILMVTPSVEALSGYPPKEVLGRPVSDFYVDDSERTELRRQLDEYGLVIDYRIRLRHKTGSVIWVSVNTHEYNDAKGRVAGVEGTFRDVSDLIRAEGKLQTLALAAENSPASIIVTDAEGLIVYVNPAYELISGYALSEVVGSNPRFQKSGQTPVEAYRDMWSSIAAGKTWRGEFVNLRKSGELYSQSVAIAPVCDMHGKINFYVAVQEDITERKQIAEDLEQARQQADAANAAKSRFLAAASHDLRQPLQAMRLYLDVLAERVEDTQNQSLVGKLQMAHTDVGNMLDRLLDISQLDAGEVQANPEVFDLSGMLRELHEQYMAQTSLAGLAWRLRVPAGTLWVDSDPVFVKEILSNLISNAIRYTLKGGILLAARRRGTTVSIEVLDTGPGIDRDKQQEIFQEFVQLGNPERDRRKGVGLGLSIASRMSRILGSHVELKSKPGHGSVFSFSLPLSNSGELIAKQQQGASVHRDFTGRRVFVIDDDPLMRDSLGMLLQQWKCSVEAFSGGEEALAVLGGSGSLPDAVIADYRLRNNTTGVQVIRNIHAVAGQSIPALLLTGDVEPERMREASAAGVPLWHKPVSALKLGLFLERHLSVKTDK